MERGTNIDLPKITRQKRLDWDALRAKVKGGIRNATLMAVAPNANIGLVAGTTPGIDPRFAQVFSRNKISGKYLDLNHNLVKDLKNMGLWDELKETIIERQGDISQIDGLPAYLKEIYKTAFTTNAYAYIEVAARAQKWVDQALSRNMYLESRDMEDMKRVYMTAWKKGLKTTYYLHMKPRHTAEQSTTNVNKAEMTGKRGFGGMKAASAAPESVPSPIEVAQPSPVRVEEPFTVSPVERIPVRVPAAETPRAGGFAGVRAAATHSTSSGQATQPMAAAKTEPVAATTQPKIEAAIPGVAIPLPASQPQMAPRVGFSTAAAAPVQPATPKMGFASVATAPTVASGAAMAPRPKKVYEAPSDPGDDPNVCIACQ
jgi:ribonucleoside-diphosphate reductase alpha chain